ncbi:MAG: hypothetical protein HKM04_02750 [Legionellales bacterium]|nr:hypothetical protein [Legionellales bacterium]
MPGYSLIQALSLPNQTKDTGWHLLARDFPVQFGQCLEMIAENDEAKQFLLTVFELQNNMQRTPWLVIFNTFPEGLSTLEQYFPDETYKQFSNFMLMRTLGKGQGLNYNAIVGAAKKQRTAMAFLGRFVYEKLGTLSGIDIIGIIDAKYRPIFSDKLVKSAVITYILSLGPEERKSAILNACTPNSELNRLLENEKDFSKLTEIYYHTKRAATLVKFIQSLRINELINKNEKQECLNLLTDINPQFSIDEHTAILNALNSKSGNLMKTGWSFVAEYTPSLLLPLLHAVGDEANLAIQLINILAVPNDEGDTGWHVLARSAHPVKKLPLQLLVCQATRSSIHY